MKNLSNNKVRQIRKYLYISLYSLLVLFTIGISLTIIVPEIQKTIEFKNSWQYVASYDFEEIIEKDDEGNDQIVYGISTPEQLAGAFMQDNKVYAETSSDVKTNLSENKKFRLTSNVNLSGSNWIPPENTFSGKLDGNGFFISNVNIVSSANDTTTGYYGFVKQNSGTIMSVYFDNINVKNSNNKITSYVGGAAGKNSGTIDNVHITSGTLTSQMISDDYSTYLGGVVGYNSGEVKNCVNHASVATAKYIGGIVGYSSKSVHNCFNYGTIDATNKDFTVGVIIGASNLSFAGGIAGYSSSSIYACYNSGKVCSEGSVSSYAGGIVGKTTATVYGCVNDGEIESELRKGVTQSLFITELEQLDNYKDYMSCSGGIVGYSTAKISDCCNKGKVTSICESIPMQIWSSSNNESDTKEYHVHSESNRDMYLRTKLKTGSILDLNSRYAKLAYAGGIVGWGTAICESCYNIGEISGGYAWKNLYFFLAFERHYDANVFWNSWTESDKVNSYVQYYYKVYYAGINGNRNLSGNTNCYATSSYLSPFDEYSVRKQTVNGSAYTDSDAYCQCLGYNFEIKNTKIDYYWYNYISRSYTTKTEYEQINYYIKSCWNMSNTNKMKGLTSYIYQLDDTVTLGHYYTTYSASSIKSMSASSLGSNWSKNSNVNGGYPYPTYLFW